MGRLRPPLPDPLVGQVPCFNLSVYTPLVLISDVKALGSDWQGTRYVCRSFSLKFLLRHASSMACSPSWSDPTEAALRISRR